MITLVGTPIGNLGDLSPRVASVLADADIVAAEDTRRARTLLSHLGLRKKLVSYHRANERQRGPDLISAAQSGQRVVLVSDAGMPGVSDPGEALVRRAVDAGVAVDVVPGPSAALVALVVSGLRTDRFVFEGFLPRRGGERSRRLAEVASEQRTVVLFEAPHRVRATLSDLAEVCGGDRRVAVARELTKLYEDVWRGELRDAVAAVGEPRGEYAIVLGGAEPSASAVDFGHEVDARVAAGQSARDAAAAVAEERGASKSSVYRHWLAHRAAPGRPVIS